MSTPLTDTGVRLLADFRVFARRPYRTVGGRSLELDLCVPAQPHGPSPVFVLFHGGGWVAGSRETVSLHLLPWMERGWATVNVEYRLAGEALAPAAAWDARAAVGWVAERAGEHRLDPDRIVVGGLSSGGHLALLTGMGADLPPEPGATGESPGPVRAAAVVSWFGISDVSALLQGDRPRAYARRWMGRDADVLDRAAALSPVRWVGGDTPPVLTIHGTADPVVPWEQSVRLHEALDRVGVPNRLLTLEGAGHGDFNAETWARVYGEVFDFLASELA